MPTAGISPGRTRFPLEVAEAVRAVWPKDKPLFLRVSAVDGLDGGWTSTTRSPTPRN